MLQNRTFMRLLAVLSAALMIPFSALTYLIDAFSASTRCEDSHSNVVGIGAYFRSQGMTADEEGCLYFSSKTTLLKTEADGRSFVAANYSAIPDDLSENCGIKHIGGLSYYNGKIYAGLEDSKVWDHPIVGVFDCDTLELVESYELDPEVHTRGLPWVAVDPATGLLYAFDHSKQPTKILSYDVNNGMAPAAEVALEEMIPSIQGGEFLDGVLYTATNDDDQSIYTVDVATGKSELFLKRGLTGGSEGEGMTFVKKDGKTCILAMDMGPLFINANLRWYIIEK